LLAVTEYFWDFGDGVKGYGNPITHTYKLSGISPQAVLRVTDNYGRRWFCRQQIYLT
jgi:PKD repeat protein